MLGIHSEDESFDINVAIYINSVLSTLTQLGFGPPEGFVITSEADSWSKLFNNRTDVEFVKTYVYLKTKLLFDPPTSASALAAMERTVKEYEWRIVNLDKPKEVRNE